MTKAGLVLTTIHDPECLEGYRKNFEKFGHLKQVEVFVITDMKTPQAAWARCEALREAWLDVHCIGDVEAAEFIQKIGLRNEMFPVNSDSRRNIGYLMALSAECDFIISIDDDNYCMSKDYFAEHEFCLASGSDTLGSNSGWFNSCDCIETPEYVFQRGYPYYPRVMLGEKITSKQGKFEVHANMGLWIGDPDIDALSWMVTPTQSRKMYSDASVILAQNTWSPINSQNTSIRAEAMPSYFFIPMDGTIMGHRIGHDGDIFQGYFFQKCMKHLGGHLRIGTPVVDHRRNSHDYFNDVEQEWYCIRLLEEMLPWLTEECTLEGKDYCSTYESLADQITEWVVREKQSKVVSGSAGYLLRVTRLMKEWAKACRLIGMRKVEA